MVNEALVKIESDPVKRMNITLRAVYGKTQGHFLTCPAKDMATGRLLGVDLLSDEEAKKAKKIINEDTTRKLEDGSVFNLNNEIDALDWKWIRETEEVAPDFDTAQSTPRAMFYVEDLDGETEKKVQLRMTRNKAENLVLSSSQDKKQKICRLLGTDPKYFSPIEIDDFLTSLAETDPSKIINVYQDENSSAKLFLYELLEKKVIARGYDGVYKFGNITLGVSEDTTLYYMRQPENVDIVKQMKLAITPSFEFIKETAPIGQPVSNPEVGPNGHNKEVAAKELKAALEKKEPEKETKTASSKGGKGKSKKSESEPENTEEEEETF